MLPLRQAMRSLTRTPVFASAVVISLALGIAAVTSMFAIVYGVLLAPLPYGEPDRLVSVGLETPQAGAIGQPPALQLTYAALAQTLDGVGFHRTGSTNLWTPGSDETAQSVVATWVSASMMPLLQVAPMLGRSFSDEEALRGGPDAVMLSEAEWRSRFDAAPDVLGRTLMVNSVPREVIGVMPASFSFPTPATRVWLPAKRVEGARVGDFLYAGVARLAPGATAAQAQQELATLLPRMADAFPRLEPGPDDQARTSASESSTATWLADARPTPVVVPLRERMTRDIAPTLWMLAGAAALVLLVAWANVANLWLVRADARHTEVAVRAALGAGRLRTASHFLGEALLLGTIAGALALLLTGGVVEAIAALGPPDVPRLAELALGWPALGFLVLVSGLGVSVCAGVPATRLWRASLARGLRDGGRSASAGGSRLRLRAVIATLQIALALVVTIGSALLLRTAHGLQQVHPGFDGAEVTTLRTQLPFARYDDAAAVAFYARMVEQVRQLPTVRSAGLTMQLPLAGTHGMLEQEFRIAGVGAARSLPLNIVDAGYFATLSIPLRAGRGFDSSEQGRATEIVINRQAAKLLFGEASDAAVVGERLALAPSGSDYTIVGIAGDVRYGDLATAPVAMAYRPLGMPGDAGGVSTARHNMALVVRSNASPAALVPALRRIVHGIDPAVSIYKVETMGEVMRATTARLSLVLAVMSVAAGTTLLLGMIGLYGVMAYMVALRTREFGVRMALGADPRRIARLVGGRGLVLVASGMVLGVALYALAAPLLRAFLFGVTPSDPASLIGAAALLAGTAAFASWLPARRAAGVEPAQSLRAD